MVFFIFSMFLGGALQLTNAYGDVFLSELRIFPKYADSFRSGKYSTIIMSIVSKTLFISYSFLEKYESKRNAL